MTFLYTQALPNPTVTSIISSMSERRCIPQTLAILSVIGGLVTQKQA